MLQCDLSFCTSISCWSSSAVHSLPVSPLFCWFTHLRIPIRHTHTHTHKKSRGSDFSSSHFIGPVICNSLPVSDGHAQTLSSFKSQLKPTSSPCTSKPNRSSCVQIPLHQCSCVRACARARVFVCVCLCVQKRECIVIPLPLSGLPPPQVTCCEWLNGCLVGLKLVVSLCKCVHCLVCRPTPSPL